MRLDNPTVPSYGGGDVECVERFRATCPALVMGGQPCGMVAFYDRKADAEAWLASHIAKAHGGDLRG